VKAILALAAAASLTAAPPASAPRPTIRDHVAVLADDSMAGREAGTPAYDRAAAYVEDQFRAAGLQPHPGTGWRQRVPLVALSPAGLGRAVVTRDGQSTILGADDIALSLPLHAADEHVSGEVVAAGHCVADAAAGIDDFAGLDLRGKIAACQVGGPAALSPTARTAHGHPTVQARAARDRGAIAVVMIQSAGQAESTSFARIARAWRAPRLALDDPAGQGRVLGLLSAGAGARLLAGGGAVSLEVDSPGRRQARPSDNVIGWLPGTDPRLRDELVIVSAHLDHIGDQVSPVIGSTDRVANGALDNAIGVATMIETARRLARAPRRQARGIVFVAFTAEEAGLLGSQWFAGRLPPTQRRTTTNVNIDMPILTYPLADLLVRGTGWTDLPGAPELERQLGLPIAQETETAPPSDNLSFLRIGVPTYVPLPGEAGEGLAASRRFRTNHYHRSSDDLSLPIDWASAERYALFVELLTNRLANR
jgi:hypothetical protein